MGRSVLASGELGQHNGLRWTIIVVQLPHQWRLQSQAPTTTHSRPATPTRRRHRTSPRRRQLPLPAATTATPHRPAPSAAARTVAHRPAHRPAAPPAARLSRCGTADPASTAGCRPGLQYARSSRSFSHAYSGAAWSSASVGRRVTRASVCDPSGHEQRAHAGPTSALRSGRPPRCAPIPVPCGLIGAPRR